MQNAYLKEFEAWWAKTTFEATRGWSRDGERKFLPCSPRKLARTAWNAAFHLMLRQANARVREVTKRADARVRVAFALLDEAKAEIDVLERTAPMPASEFESRMLAAKNAILSAKVRSLQGEATVPTMHINEALRSAATAVDLADKKLSEINAALRSALDEYDKGTRGEHIIPECANALEARIRTLLEAA